MNNNQTEYNVVVEVVEKSFEIYYYSVGNSREVSSKTKAVRFWAKVRGENNNIIECHVEEDIYNRLVEGMKINAKIHGYITNSNKTTYSIDEIKLIYDETTNMVVKNYVDSERKKLAVFSKNNGLRDEKGKSGDGIFVIMSLIFLVFGILGYVIKIKNNVTSMTNELVVPLVFINICTFSLLISIMYNIYSLKYSVIAKKFYIIFSIAICDVITAISNIYVDEKHYVLNIIITAILAIAIFVLFRKGFRYTRTRTKFRFAVINVFDINGGYRVVLSKLSDDAYPTGYPYLVYDTNNGEKFKQFKYMDLDVKNITSLNLNINNPDYWYYDISYVDDKAFVGKNICGVTNFVYVNR